MKEFKDIRPHSFVAAGNSFLCTSLVESRAKALSKWPHRSADLIRKARAQLIALDISVQKADQTKYCLDPITGISSESAVVESFPSSSQLVGATEPPSHHHWWYTSATSHVRL